MRLPPARNLLTKVVFLRIIGDGYAAPHFAGSTLEPSVLADLAAFGLRVGV